MYLLTPCPAESRSESFINLPPSLTATVVGRKRMCEKTSSLLGVYDWMILVVHDPVIWYNMPHVSLRESS